MPDLKSVTQGTSLNKGWLIWDGDSRKGVNVSLPDFGKTERLDLPDRRLLPNTAIWYKRKADLMEGVLMLDSDDGAQLWIDRSRVPAIHDGTVYPVGAAEDAEIVVRVINNAMRGGLEEVINITRQDWDAYSKAKKGVSDRRLKAKKEIRANRITGEEDLILLHDPIWLRSQKGQYFLIFSTEEAGRAEVRMQGDGHESTLSWESESPHFKIPMPEPQGELKYSIRLGEAWSKEYRFSYAEENEAFSFAFWGDSQSGWDTFRELVDLMDAYGPDFTVGAGDLVGNGSDEEEYYRFMQILSRSEVIHYPVPGNHDYDGYYEDLQPRNYVKMLQLPEQQQYVAWTHGNAAFIALDPNMFFPVSVPDTSQQYQWFMEQLETDDWKDAEWRFITLHQPPFSQGWPGYSGDKYIEDLLIPLLEKHKIDGVLTGHTHDYERLIRNYGAQQVAFVISGGGGGGLEPEGLTPEPEMDIVIKEHHFVHIQIQKNKATFSAINLENEIIDEFTLKHE